MEVRALTGRLIYSIKINAGEAAEVADIGFGSQLPQA